jgi:hypothetical protein
MRDTFWNTKPVGLNMSEMGFPNKQNLQNAWIKKPRQNFGKAIE